MSLVLPWFVSEHSTNCFKIGFLLSRERERESERDKGVISSVRKENGDLLTGGCEAHNGPFVRRAGEIRSEGRAERARG